MLNGRLSKTGLAIASRSVGKIGFGFLKRCSAEMAKFKPDIVFVAKGAHEILQGSDLMRSIGTENGSTPPLLYLTAPCAVESFAELLGSKQVTRVVISNLGVVDRLGAEHFVTVQGAERLYHVIDPVPKFEFRELPADQRNCRLIGKKDIFSVLWKNSRFDPDDFFALQTDYLNIAERLRAHETTVYLQEDQTLFVGGILLRDIVQFRLHGVPIEQIVDQETIFSCRETRDSFWDRFCQSLYSRQNRQYLSRSSSKPEAVKRHIPVQVRSPHLSVRKIFASLLEANGFHKASFQPERAGKRGLRLDLTQRAATVSRDGEINFFIPLPKLLSQGWNFRALDRFASRYGIDPAKIGRPSNIEKRKRALHGKIRKEKTRIKIADGSGKLKNRESYRNFMALRKLDILAAILENAIVWDEKKNESASFDEDYALVFYDDYSQGKAISRQLLGIRKQTLFINISNKLNELHKIADIDTDRIEPFLYSGLVVCSVTSKIILSRNFRLYRYRLMQESEETLSDEERLANRKLAALTLELTELSYIDLYQTSENIYHSCKGRMMEAIKEGDKHNQYGKCKADSVQRVALATREKEIGRMVGSAVKDIFRENFGKSIDIRLVWADLALRIKPNEEDGSQSEEVIDDPVQKEKVALQNLACQNAIALSTFFHRIVYQVKHCEADLLIVAYEAEIISVLIRMIRQELPLLAAVPIVAVVMGESVREDLDELLELGIGIVSLDYYTMQDREAIKKEIAAYLV